jgi:hypothetical protein
MPHGAKLVSANMMTSNDMNNQQQQHQLGNATVVSASYPQPQFFQTAPMQMQRPTNTATVHFDQINPIR